MWRVKSLAAVALAAGLVVSRALYQPQLAPAAAQSATPPPSPILYSDTFDNPAAGRLAKTSATPDKYARGYANGEYRIQTLDPAWERVATATIPGTFGEAAVAIDARLVGETASRFVAIVCRNQRGTAGSSQYRLVVRSDNGQFSLARWDDGKQTLLARYQASDAILGGNRTNRLELECVGDRITVAINGFEVASVHDGTYQDGGIWFGAGSFAGANVTADARLDNLVVSRPDPLVAPLSLRTSPLVQLASLRDQGEQAIAAGDVAALEGVAEALSQTYDRLADETPSLGVAPYHRTTAAWAAALAYGAEQALGDLAKQQGDAAVSAGDGDGLQRVLAIAQNQQRRLDRVAPWPSFAGYQQQLNQFAAGAADAATQALVATLSQSPDAPAFWATYPVLPAPGDIPIAAGLLPVPQEFQVVEPTTGQAFFGQPPSGRLWDVAKATGPACDGPGERPKFVMVAGQRGATSAYPAGCFVAADPDSGQLPQLDAPAAGDIVPDVKQAIEDEEPQAVVAGGTGETGQIQVPCVLRTLRCIGAAGQPRAPAAQPGADNPPAPVRADCQPLAKATPADVEELLKTLKDQLTRLQDQKERLETPAANPAVPKDTDKSAAALPAGKLPAVPNVTPLKDDDTQETLNRLNPRIAQLKALIDKLEAQQPGGPNPCPPAGPAAAAAPPAAAVAPPAAAGVAPAAAAAAPGRAPAGTATRVPPTATRAPPTPTRTPPSATPVPTVAPAQRGTLPYYANYSGCDYGGGIFGTGGAYHNAYFELQAAWSGLTSNVEINTLIDRGISGIRDVIAARTRAGFTDSSYNQRCIDFLNSARALLR
ncbi:MAG: hypothetical protein HY332_22160 [Chloroflexi bacterium]|nr:hypothetical protein [Chloroflexota bacterium]